MPEFPLVTIITVTYNHEKFIGHCIESVLSQTYPFWNQIIIDDGSKDRTAEVVNKYKDQRITYINQGHLGIYRLSETYNNALTLSKGEIIATLEGDDFWPPYKLEKQLHAFKFKENVLSWGKVAITNKYGEQIKVWPKKIKRKHQNMSKKRMLEILLLYNYIPPSTVLIRKDCILSIGGFKQPKNSPFTDYLTWLEIALHGNLYPVNEVLGYWRRHENQITSRKCLELIMPIKYKLEFYDKLPRDYKESMNIDHNKIISNHQYQVASNYSHLGRIDLNNKRWDKAREKFIKSFREGDSMTKIKAIFGLFCCKYRISLKLKYNLHY